MSSSSTSDVQYIPRKAKLKRSVVVDGQNILHSFTHTRSTKGNHLECIDVLPVLRYFLVRKFPVQVVVPRFFLSSKRNVVKNSFVMVELLKIGLLLASQYQHSDDLLAVKAAYVSGGAILSKLSELFVDRFPSASKLFCEFMLAHLYSSEFLF
ncbi:hypothetical protein AB6A40_011463 [Gnathostoma spinigerum]|uniref:RNase NYN domain-containing protein n=1 Tax=Gnathostoma spinigerum TaxID=75299 RepID=A0ABD6F3E5_9BILA